MYTLKMKVEYSFEMFLFTYKRTWGPVTEDHNLKNHCREGTEINK
jgi:hypothetical protein